MGTGKQLGQIAAFEIGRAAKNIANEIENQNTDSQKEIENRCMRWSILQGRP